MGKSKKSRKVQNFRADPTSSNGTNGSNGHSGDFIPTVTTSVLDTISAQLQSGGFWGVIVVHALHGWVLSFSQNCISIAFINIKDNI